VNGLIVALGKPDRSDTPTGRLDVFRKNHPRAGLQLRIVENAPIGMPSAPTLEYRMRDHTGGSLRRLAVGERVQGRWGQHRVGAGVEQHRNLGAVDPNRHARIIERAAACGIGLK
jgi:hypothetical protein